MKKPRKRRASLLDPRMLIERLTGDAFWSLVEGFPAPSIRRILQAVFHEIEEGACTDEEREKNDQRILENARLLGFNPTASKEDAGLRARGFLDRHRRLQALRQAEELLCLYLSVDVQESWARSAFEVTGCVHAEKIVADGAPAVVVSAHVGPMIYYIPLLVYFLSKAGSPPRELIAVMNEPPDGRMRRIKKQLADFAAYHRTAFDLLCKQPGGDLALVRSCRAALGRGSWLLMQLDVLSGGSTAAPLPLAGVKVRFPALRGAVRLAVRCKVPLLPVRAYRTENDGLGLAIEPPIRPDAFTTREEEKLSTDRTSRTLMKHVEKWICADPADWGRLAQLHLFCDQEL